MRSGPRLGARMSVLLVFSSACVCIGNMARPVHQLTTGDSICSGNIAMDGQRDVWTESGCEASSTGWEHRNTATSAESARVGAAFARLPAPGQSCGTAGGDGGIGPPSIHRLSLITDEGESRWTACATDDGGIAVPFDEAVSAMQALVPPP